MCLPFLAQSFANSFCIEQYTKHTVFHMCKTYCIPYIKNNSIHLHRIMVDPLGLGGQRKDRHISFYGASLFFFISRSRISYDSSIYSASLYCAYRYYFCLFLKVATLHCINLLAPSPIAFANFMFLSHILVIFEIFQTFLLYLYGDL